MSTATAQTPCNPVIPHAGGASSRTCDLAPLGAPGGRPPAFPAAVAAPAPLLPKMLGLWYGMSAIRKEYPLFQRTAGRQRPFGQRVVSTLS